MTKLRWREWVGLVGGVLLVICKVRDALVVL